MKHSIYMVEFSIALVVLTGVYFLNIPSPSFHQDESQWIGSSYYFESFIQSPFDSSVWNKSYWTLTQPPLTRYTIAIGRLAGGYQTHELNVPWNGDVGRAENEARGAIPDLDLLWWSRLPMALLAAGSGLIFFLAAYIIGGRLTGFSALFFFVATPYLPRMLGRAMGETSLLFWTMLAASMAVVALYRCQQRQGLWWLVGVGVCSGLAGSAKLNGIAAAGMAILLALFVFFKYRQALTEESKRFMTTAVLLAPLITVLTFFLLNPFLYRQPINRLNEMWEHRIGAMQRQQISSSDSAITNLETRLQVLPQRIFVSYTPTQLEMPLFNILLTAVGLAYLVWLSKGWFAAGSVALSETTALVAMSIALFMVLPPLGTPLDWDRYFLFPVIFNLLCTAVAISIVWRGLVHIFQHVLKTAHSN